MKRPRPPYALAVVVAGLALVACGRARVDRGDTARCGHVQTTRSVRGVSLCEDAWACERPPGGPLDRVSLTRIAPCGDLTGPLALYLPDRHHNGDVRGTDARSDLRLYLAQAGIRTWGLGYRTHARMLGGAAGAAPSDWTFDTFADDVQWAMGFIRGAEASRGIWLVAAGDGATFAYEMARRGEPLLAGIVAVDGAAVAAPAPGGGALLEPTLPGLSWERHRALVERAADAPRSASPVPGYATAGEALAAHLYAAEGSGGPAAPSAARDRSADVGAVARYLAAEDRWWPRALLRSDMPGRGKRTLPVLAFAAGRRGADWIRIVRESAERFGGERAVVRVLPQAGHLDTLVGFAAPHQVYEPLRAFITSH